MRILKLLNAYEFYAEDETIEIAKGKNKMPETFKEGYKQLKRNRRWQIQ
jgi:hypothetical protein|tara:strand:- start:528 stop:674 length:147 start_codon:yes stop_codon:yes gene_type:complete